MRGNVSAPFLAEPWCASKFVAPLDHSRTLEFSCIPWGERGALRFQLPSDAVLVRADPHNSPTEDVDLKKFPHLGGDAERRIRQVQHTRMIKRAPKNCFIITPRWLGSPNDGPWFAGLIYTLSSNVFNFFYKNEELRRYKVARCRGNFLLSVSHSTHLTEHWITWPSICTRGVPPLGFCCLRTAVCCLSYFSAYAWTVVF